MWQMCWGAYKLGVRLAAVLIFRVIVHNLEVVAWVMLVASAEYPTWLQLWVTSVCTYWCLEPHPRWTRFQTIEMNHSALPPQSSVLDPVNRLRQSFHHLVGACLWAVQLPRLPSGHCRVVGPN